MNIKRFIHLLLTQNHVVTTGFKLPLQVIAYNNNKRDKNVCSTEGDAKPTSRTDPTALTSDEDLHTVG